MDYRSMSVRELQQACRDRGLPTARDKDTMAARLAEHDDASTDTPQAHLGEGEVVQSQEAVRHAAEPQAAAPAVWRETFPAHDGGLGDTEHAANRRDTLAAAIAAGHRPMGDAYRTGTTNGRHTYEVHLRGAR